MFKKFVSCFVKNADDVENPAVRKKYGSLSGIVGIIINVILSLSKIIVGLVVGAISVVSDGINNLSDAGSSVITLVGFKLSNKKPDKEHPFGHGRMEYFAGLIVSIIIIVVAIELFIESLGKVINLETMESTSNTLMIITCAILVFSIIAKLWLALFNNYVGKKIKSVAITSTSKDSISDCVSTSVVLVCSILSMFIVNVPIDGIGGIIVSIFIFYTGLRSTLEVLNLLIGSAPDQELIKDISDYVENYDKNVVGIHDLMLHDYGPGRKFLMLHVEVPASGDIMTLHDLIDNIETGVNEKFNLLTTIHMDPVVVDSERVTELKKVLVDIVKELDENFSIHDFRMNEGDTHANLIFDLVITHETKLTHKEIISYIESRIKAYDKNLNVVAKIEYSMV